jgi:hypothetical protein
MPYNYREREGMIMYLPAESGDRRRVRVNRIDVRPAPSAASSTSRTLIFDASTSAGSVAIILSAGEAAGLMFEIGYALERANLSASREPSTVKG